MFQILVVDDEVHVTDALTMLLSEQTDIDSEVLAANSAREAMALLEKHRIDLMLTDINMPDMSGIELLEQTSKRWPLCQVVMLTGYSDFNHAYDAFRLKAAGFLLKTEPEKVLIATIRERLREAEHRLAQENMPEGPVAYAAPSQQLLRLAASDAPRRGQLLEELGFQPPWDRVVLCMSSPLSGEDGGLAAHQLDMLVRRHMGARVQRTAYALAGQGQVVWLMQLTGADGGLPLVSSILETVQSICRSARGKEVSFALSLAPPDSMPMTISRLRSALEKSDDQLGSIVTLSSASPTAFSAESIVHFVKNYIRQHVTEGITISMLSQASGYNADYLSRIFRIATGETIGQYLNYYRVDMILSLMRNESLSVDEIARQTGFASRSYFNRFVKRATGMNPKALRMSLSGETGP